MASVRVVIVVEEGFQLSAIVSDQRAQTMGEARVVDGASP
jgi:hypothetical protein